MSSDVPTYFFDTSALVKRYHEEPGTARVDESVEDEANDVIVSTLLVIETASAFRRKRNRGDVSEREMNQLLGAFFNEALDASVIVPVEESMLAFSFDLVLEDDLRTLDSLQLSAGRSLDRELDGVTFVTADESLAAVAERHGLATVVPA